MTHLIDELRRMAGSLFDVPSQEIVFTMRSRSVTVSREQGSETILVTKLADYYRDPAEDPWANLAKCLAKKASERQATAYAGHSQAVTALARATNALSAADERIAWLESVAKGATAGEHVTPSAAPSTTPSTAPPAPGELSATAQDGA